MKNQNDAPEQEKKEDRVKIALIAGGAILLIISVCLIIRSSSRIVNLTEVMSQLHDL